MKGFRKLAVNVVPVTAVGINVSKLPPSAIQSTVDVVMPDIEAGVTVKVPALVTAVPRVVFTVLTGQLVPVPV